MHHNRNLLGAEEMIAEVTNDPGTNPGTNTACLAREQVRLPPFIAETRRFLGHQELVAKRANFPMYDLPQLHQAIASCFPDWQLAAEGGAPESRTGLLWVPEKRRMLVAPGRWAEYAHEATRFYRLPDGGRRVLGIDYWHNLGKGGFSVRLFAPLLQEEKLAAEFGALLARMARPHYLHGQVLNPDAEILEALTPCSWDDVALEAGVREAIEQNTMEVLRRREAFKRYGVPLKRGILLYGPPGTGKTLLAKVLAGLKLATFLYATAADMAMPGEVRGIFELARKLAPTIVFFEDLDFFAQERSFGRNYTLGEILAQLDGFENNDGLIFIATTNDLEAIDPAIRARPSRFDVVLHLGLPAPDARRKILVRNLPAGSVTERLLDDAAVATDGFSGAQVREVAYLALQRAILREACDSKCPVRLQEQDVVQSVARLKGKRETVVGFGRPGVT